MAGRIKRVRGELQEALTHKSGDRDWGFITRQIGMFSFTGLTPTQVGRWVSGSGVSGSVGQRVRAGASKGVELGSGQARRSA